MAQHAALCGALLLDGSLELPPYGADSNEL
jgi:hypothetical protein